MESQLEPLAAILDLNTDLLLNCLDDLTDKEAQVRLPGGGNSLIFLAAHLTESRHFLAARIGPALPNPLASYLADARGIQDVSTWPTLAELRSAWCSVGRHLKAALAELTAAELAKPNAVGFPIDDDSQLGMIAFLVQHDSYHVGQAAFVRRQLGKPAMTYRRGASAAATAGAV